MGPLLLKKVKKLYEVEEIGANISGQRLKQLRLLQQLRNFQEHHMLFL